MPIRESENSLELQPSGYLELIIILFLGLILASAGIYSGIKLGSLVYKLIFPLGLFLGLSLIIFGITRFLIIWSGQISTIIFTESGIVFQNMKQVILSSFLWKEIEGITICQWDDEKNPIILCIITKNDIERIDLKKYNTISITCEDLWKKISNFYEKYK
ncbi:MAG: hypothetical protein EAX90_00505 [Candidatus Heimdallarchaeota archaeon]|nr:hypothetical protein [Candidatus Heimdallarchaeota archaeon]